MVHWRMLPNIKRTNKTNSIQHTVLWIIQHLLTHVRRPESPRHQNQTMTIEKNIYRERKLHITVTHEIRRKLPQQNTSIFNTVI